jgi:uncharacterized protein YecE (DUF72 family)
MMAQARLPTKQGYLPSQLRVGCAGWAITKQYASRFPATGSHLERYAACLRAVEVNSCFYRSHRPSTYARWAAETPSQFAFSLKLPKEITHERRLVKTDGAISRFLAETAELGPKRGAILVQLPPSLAFDAKLVENFFTTLRRQYDGEVVCEPRHVSWFTLEPETLLTRLKVARVAADPSVVRRGAEPGGWAGTVYYRLHGSPQMYCSQYPAQHLVVLANALVRSIATANTWCIFDNTALGAATGDALSLVRRIEELIRPPRGD